MEYVRLEIDLVHEAFASEPVRLVQRFVSIFREREVVEVEGLFRPVAGTLRALSLHGFDRVDHWEAHPGGWLPLPEPAHERLTEPAGHLLNALRDRAWSGVAKSRAFSVRLSGAGSVRADLTVRRVHRERSHSVTLELRGTGAERVSRGIERSLRTELSIARLRRARTPIFSVRRR
ncbi:MAG TPA: hypothetical protein VMH38_02470 [Thermoplasmata archaeon]|nr:hypothetical protein [Thermoplasmata archaeon]